MRHHHRPAILGLLLIAALVASAGASPPDGPQAPSLPAKAEARDGPIPIFLNAPSDRDAFWKMLDRPDLVILHGELYRKLRDGADAARSPASLASSLAFGSIVVEGHVDGDRARLTVDLRVNLTEEGPAWVPIRLDGLAVSEVREAGRDLPARASPARAWSVELTGRGEHAVRVVAIAPVGTTAEGGRLDLAIPASASTRVGLTVHRPVLDAASGPDEPVAVESLVDDARASRLSSVLGPRPRIELAWRERLDPAVGPSATLAVNGEIAVDVERDSIKARSSWSIAALRGSASTLTTRLDPDEVLVGLELDDRPMAASTRAEGGRAVVDIPLGEPVRVGVPRSVVITTRRPIDATATTRVRLGGYPFDHAKVQLGALAIARVGPLFVNASAGRGLRRVDPRTELPESLRARPETVLAFEFNDQPFVLNLTVEPVSPRLRVESRSTVTVGPRSARVETRLDCRVAQGRPFEVRVLVPRGLEWESAGPPDVVSPAQAVPVDPKAGPGGARVLTLPLNRMGRELEPFAIELRGRCAIDPSSGPVAVPLFVPIDDPTAGRRVAVVAEPGVGVERAVADSSPFRDEPGPPPADWPRGSGPEPASVSALLWLRGDANPEALPLAVVLRPRLIRHESTLTATFDRLGADVVEEVSGEVAPGPLPGLELALPAEVPGHWIADGPDLDGSSRELVAQEPDGTRRYRLQFARALADAFRFRVRYRVPFARPLGPGRDEPIRLGHARVIEGTSIGRTIRLAAGPNVELRPEGPGWSAGDPDESGSSGSESGPPIRALRSGLGDEAAVILARMSASLTMPAAVASRLWLRTTQRLDGDLASTAWYWLETRGPTLTVKLPGGSRWIKARVGGEALTAGDVASTGGDEYRIRFPGPTAQGSTLLGIDYEVPAAATTGGWPAPSLGGNAVVQQTLWEAGLTGARAGVGVPSGWSDENEWYWDGLLARRRPRIGPAELAHWLTGGGARQRMAEVLESGEQGGRHAYLFERPGAPSDLKLAVFSRSTLLGLGSGPTLVVGLLILARRPPPRLMIGALLVLAFAIGAFAEPNALIQVVQSSALGFLLLLAGVAMHGALERRGRAGTVVAGLGPTGVAGPIASSVSRLPSIGSDDSTEIRPRPAASTADHVARTAPRGLDEPSALGMDRR